MSDMIEFTCGNINNTLLFLDMLNCTGNDLKLSIYHKSINKNVLINFYSHDNNKFIIYNFYFKFRIICKVLLKFISKKILKMLQTDSEISSNFQF